MDIVNTTYEPPPSGGAYTPESTPFSGTQGGSGSFPDESEIQGWVSQMFGGGGGGGSSWLGMLQPAGENNSAYQSALSQWQKTDPSAANQFNSNASNSKDKKATINNLQMAINKGEITRQQASILLTKGPAAGEYNFNSKGHTGTSAGAYAIANQTGGPLDGGSSDPKKYGREYDASQVLSLGGLLKNPISTLLDPTVSHSFSSVMGSAFSMLNPIGSMLGSAMPMMGGMDKMLGGLF
ncbi:hypothetical protein PQR05_08710 [Paraburkholderia sediminicola]|uniref:hypothetical protein n=1 Tax=Paraburkholderia sediminicola TaxID=458836 RepID=UPI0038BA0355